MIYLWCFVESLISLILAAMGWELGSWLIGESSLPQGTQRNTGAHRVESIDH